MRVTYKHHDNVWMLLYSPQLSHRDLVMLVVMLLHYLHIVMLLNYLHILSHRDLVMLVSPSLLPILPLARKDRLEPSNHETHASSALAISDTHPAEIGQTREILVVAVGDGMEGRDNVMVRILKSPLYSAFAEQGTLGH